MLLFCDSFSHYSGSQVLDKYDYSQTNPPNAFHSPGALGVGSYLELNGTMCHILSTPQNSLTVGMRVQYPSAAFVDNYCFFYFVDEPGNFMAGVFIDNDGALKLKLAINSESSQTPVLVFTGTSGACNVQQWFYLECAITLDQAAGGSVAFRVNGQDAGSATNIQTCATVSNAPPCYSLGIGSPDVSQLAGDSYIQDLYVLAGTPGFLGDCQVGFTPVAGVGATTDLQPYPAGSTNWQNAAENPPTGDSNYNYGSISGDSDAYATAAFPNTSGAIAGFQLIAFARKDDAGSRAMKIGVGNGSTVDLNPTELSLNETYKFFAFQYDTNPLTSAPLEPADFNTLQLVAEVV